MQLVLILACIGVLAGRCTLVLGLTPSVAPEIISYLGGPGNEADGNGNYAVISAAEITDEDLELCDTTTYPIYQEDLVDMPMDTCQNSVGYRLPYAQNSSFGITWVDDSPVNCSIMSVTIAIQAGYSCSGSTGSTSLNDYATPLNYNFPFGGEYNGSCTCEVPHSPLQVFNLHPRSAYVQGGNNTFLIHNSTGDNGLRNFVPNAALSIFGLIITNQWKPAGVMDSERTQFAYAPTQLGTVLAAGGVTINGMVTNTADEYFPVEAAWKETATPMNSARQLNQIAAIQDVGKPDSAGAYYLVTSGGISQAGSTLSSAEIYNTSSRTWNTTSPMLTSRARHTLTSVFNHSNIVLAVGGLQGSQVGEYTALASIETFSWENRSWQWTPQNLTIPRYRHRTVMLDDWTALIMGGQGDNRSGIASVESLCLSTGAVTTMASMHDARYAFTATVLMNGSVMVVGGAQLPNTDTTWKNSQLLASCEIYVNGTWYLTGSLTFPRAGHQATLGDDGNVLVIGGGGSSAQTASELWNAVSGQWVTIAPLPVPKINFGVARLPYDRVLAFGGSVNSTVTTTNGTSSTYLYSAPFSLSNQSAFLKQASPSSAPSAQVPERDSYRAPPIAAETPPVVNTRDVPSNVLFALGPLPANVSLNVVLEQGLSGGTIAGIVGGALGGVLILAAITVFILYTRRKRRRAKRYSPEGLEKIHNQYGSGSLSQSPRSSGLLVYREDGTPVYLFDSRHSGPESLKSGDPLVYKSSSSGNKTSSKTMGPHHSVMSSPFQGVKTVESLDMDSGPRKSGGTQGGQSYESSAVMMPRGIPSPFGMDTGTSLTQKSSEGLTTKGMKSVGGTSTEGGSRTPDTYGSTVAPIAPLNAMNERSTGSDLSRVSFAVRSELENADWKVDRSALMLEKRLGKGGFGEVFRGQHHGSPVAIKVLEISDDRKMQDACHEFGHLHNLRHSKLVVSYGACIDGANMMLVMELMEEDLFHAIANDATGAGDSVLWNFRGWQIAVDVASALVFLHSKGRVHLDVKSLNILLKGRRTEAKLGDLGLAKLIPDGHLALQNTLPGTPAYSAPEVLEAQLSWRLRTQGRRDAFSTQVGTPADIFAFGVVLFEICTGQHPARWRQDFDGTFRPDQAPPEIALLVDNCLNDEPGQRPSARQLLDVLLQNKPKHLK